MTEPAKTEIDLVAECIGFRAALIICAHHGGRTLYVPDKPSTSHRLAREIGYRPLQRLCDVFGSQSINVPNIEPAVSRCEAQQIAVNLRARGVRPELIGIALGRSKKTIERWLSASEV
jgi:hypothetical protein